MNKFMIFATSLAMATTIVGCDRQASKAKADADSMAEMAMATEMMHGMGVGTVTSIASSRNNVTLDHGTIEALGWPAMKMGFAIEPQLLGEIKVGEKVTFEVDWDGKTGTVTAIEKLAR